MQQRNFESADIITHLGGDCHTECAHLTCDLLQNTIQCYHSHSPLDSVRAGALLGFLCFIPSAWNMPDT